MCSLSIDNRNQSLYWPPCDREKNGCDCNQTQENAARESEQTAACLEKERPALVSEIDTKDGKKTLSKPAVSKPFLLPPEAACALLNVAPEMAEILMKALNLVQELGTKSAQNSLKEAEAAQAEVEMIHEKFLSSLKETIEKSESAKSWGPMTQWVSWFASCSSIVAGIGLILSGVGAVAGAMLIVGGVIVVGSQIMEITGGWLKVTELLPGDDPDKRAAVISWIQIGLMVLSIILGGAGVLCSGTQVLSTGWTTAQMFIESIALGGSAICTLGQSITNSRYLNEMAENKELEIKIQNARHKRLLAYERATEAFEQIKKTAKEWGSFMRMQQELFKFTQTS